MSLLNKWVYCKTIVAQPVIIDCFLDCCHSIKATIDTQLNLFTNSCRFLSLEVTGAKSEQIAPKCVLPAILLKICFVSFGGTCQWYLFKMQVHWCSGKPWGFFLNPFAWWMENLLTANSVAAVTWFCIRKRVLMQSRLMHKAHRPGCSITLRTDIFSEPGP